MPKRTHIEEWVDHFCEGAKVLRLMPVDAVDEVAHEQEVAKHSAI